MKIIAFVYALVIMLTLPLICVAAEPVQHIVTQSILDTFKLGMDDALLVETGAHKQLPDLGNYMSQVSWQGAAWNVFINTHQGVAVNIIWSAPWQAHFLPAILKEFEEKGYTLLNLHNNTDINSDSQEPSLQRRHATAIAALKEVNDSTDTHGGAIFMPPDLQEALIKANATKQDNKAVFAAHRMYTCYTVQIGKKYGHITVVINTPHQWIMEK